MWRRFKKLISDLLRRGLAALKTRTSTQKLEWHTASGKPSAGFDPADRETYFHHLDEGSAKSHGDPSCSDG